MNLKMNLNQLRAFYVVVKTGNFSSAADELFVTEPAVFIQVRSFESQLGFKLLDRFGKELKPTEIGKILYDYAERIFNLVDEATNAVKEFQDLSRGYLRIGTAKALAQYLMPAIVSSFQDNRPGIKVRLDERSSQELVEGILNHRYELAIVARVPYPEKINVIPLSRDEILLVVATNSKLLQKDKVSLQELTGEPIICRDIGSATRFTIWNEFEKRGLKTSAIIEAGNTEFIKYLVKKGKGYSFLPSICVRDDIKRGEMATINLIEGKFALNIDVIHLKKKSLSPAASTFLKFLQDNSNKNNIGQFTDEIAKKSSIT